MSNHDTDLNSKQWRDITQLIKVISDSLKLYMDNIKDPSDVPGKDISLMAMQVLSLLCGLSRGYTKTELDELWHTSMKISSQIHSQRDKDSVDKGLQVSSMSAVKGNFKQ